MKRDIREVDNRTTSRRNANFFDRNAFDKWFNVIFGGINYDKELKKRRESAAMDSPTEETEKSKI